MSLDGLSANQKESRSKNCHRRKYRTHRETRVAKLHLIRVQTFIEQNENRLFLPVSGKADPHPNG